MHLLGYDIATGFVRASLVDAQTGALCAHVMSPLDRKIPVIVKKPGWAEQDPAVWWEELKTATAMLKQQVGSLDRVQAIGITYQMHGLVIVNNQLEPLRPAILWSDSRAVSIGESALNDIGKRYCLNHYLNSPGNLTASKLKWVKDNEPEIYKKMYKVMLPGDYIAARLTGDVTTTISGLSEAILWDFIDNKPAARIMDYFGFNESSIPRVVSAFSEQGFVTHTASNELGIKAGTPVTYRAGDQPNNSFSLNVGKPGEVAAATAGSGVVYGITDRLISDPHSRINMLAHIGFSPHEPLLGVMLCVNGIASAVEWIHSIVHVSTFTGGERYASMDGIAQMVSPGAQGVSFLPYGQGAERSLGNAMIHSSVHGLDFTAHSARHLVRAAVEGLAFSMCNGIEVMREIGANLQIFRARYENLFTTSVFTETLATVIGVPIVLYQVNGADGAARGAGVGAKIFASADDVMKHVVPYQTVDPNVKERDAYMSAYRRWQKILAACLASRAV